MTKIRVNALHPIKKKYQVGIKYEKGDEIKFSDGVKVKNVKHKIFPKKKI